MFDVKDLKILFTKEEIDTRVKELADLINKDYENCKELVIITVLKGSIIFVADLVRGLDIPCTMECIRLASYGNETTSSGKVKPVDLTLPNLNGKDVLVVEDIVDTGLTASFFLDYLRYQHRPNSLKFVALLDKPSKRTNPIHIDYIGFNVGDQFIIGYGLDYKGFFRNLPFIGYYEGSHGEDE